MSDNENLKKDKQIKSYIKQDEQGKSTKQEKPKNITNVENEKEKQEKIILAKEKKMNNQKLY